MATMMTADAMRFAKRNVRAAAKAGRPLCNQSYTALLARGAGRLVSDTYAIGVHGVTGQDVDEGFLAAGTLVRRARVSVEEFGTVTRFQASTDSGKSWYDQRTYGHLVVQS